MMLYLELIFRFFKTGLFSIGGGLATLPFLQQIADETGWFTRMDLADMIAVSESTPGPIGINMATYVGFRVGSVNGLAGGILGAICATLSIITPSIIVILIVSYFLKKFMDNKYVIGAFNGIRPASAALVTVALFNLFIIVIFNGDTLDFRIICLLVVLFIITNLKCMKKVHPVVFILLGAVVGNIFGFAS